MRMSADLRDLFIYEAFLYYNPLLLIVSIFQFYFRTFGQISEKIDPICSVFNVVDIYGLALGSKSLGFCTIVCQLCKNI